MKNFTVRNLISAVSGEFHGDAGILDREFSFVTTDSRTAGEGCLFIAIKGNNTDGRYYISSAAEKGALCALAERLPESGEGENVVLVGDIDRAVREAAAFYRWQFDIPFIGITGSNGKTTAKELIYHVLSKRFNVHKTEGNLNNELGVPLTVFGLREEHEIAVVEMGISNFGEMSRLAEIVRPNAAVYTVIGYSHLADLGDRCGVLKAKSEMLGYLPPDAPVFVNGDDDKLSQLDCAQKKMSFGLSPHCDVYAEDIRFLGDSSECMINCGGKRFAVHIPAYGEHMIYATLEAAAVGMYYGLDAEEIASGILNYVPVGDRGRYIDNGKIVIIDDCYNSNPTSCALAISSLTRLSGRKVCILGDMLDMGKSSEALHYNIGRLAREKGIALLMCCGTESGSICLGAGERGRYFRDIDSLISALPFYIRQGDAVLVKASRSLHFEKVAEALEGMEL